MKFGGILKKGAKQAYKEDLAVSDPGSEDSWDQLYKKVPSSHPIQTPSTIALPPNTLSNDGSTASCPTTVHLNPVIDNEKEKKEMTSSEKNATLSKNADVHTNAVRTSPFLKPTPRSYPENSQSLIPITSTPFVREKRAPAFDVSPIVSSVNGIENNGSLEDASPLVDSTASLVVKRKNPKRHVDAFDQLLEPSKNLGKNTTNQFPGIQPLKSTICQADTTRQYAGGIIRGVKTFQEQFSGFDAVNSVQEKSAQSAHTNVESPHSESRDSGESIMKDDKTLQNNKESQDSSRKSVNSPRKISLLSSSKQNREQQAAANSIAEENRLPESDNQICNSSPVKTVPASMCEVLQSCKKSISQKLGDNETTVGHSRNPQIISCKPESSKTRKSLQIEQKSEAREVVCPSNSEASETSLWKPVPDRINQESTESVKDNKGVSGNKMFNYQSKFAVQIGNTCLIQSSAFAFALQAKSHSCQALPSTEIQSDEVEQRDNLEDCARDQENHSKNLPGDVSKIEKHNSTVDIHPIHPAAESEGLLSTVTESRRPESCTETVTCPPSKSPVPNTIKNCIQTSSIDKSFDKSLSEKTNTVITKPTGTVGDLIEIVSSSEEENILLRAQSKKLRENQSNPSRVMKSPKIIDTRPLGDNPQGLGKRLRFSTTLQSPSKHSEEAARMQEHDIQKTSMSPRVRFEETLNQKRQFITQGEEGNLSDSSFEAGIFLSRNPSDMHQTCDDNFVLEIMSSSEDENIQLRKHKKHAGLRSGQEKTKFKNGGLLSSRVKKMRQRKEAQIEALLNSKANDSDSESQDCATHTAKSGLASITPSSDQGSGKRSGMNKKDPKVWRPGRTRKARIKNQDEKTIVPLKNLKNSQNNVHSVDDNYLLQEQPQINSQIEDDIHAETQSGHDTKRRGNVETKSRKTKKVIPKQKSTTRSTEHRNSHSSEPKKTSGERFSSHRYSQRVRKPPSQYWLNRNSHISALVVEEPVLIQNDFSPPQRITYAEFSDNDRIKTKPQKRKVIQNNMKASKKIKSSESEHSSQNVESQAFPALENVLFGSVNKDISCSANEVKELNCVYGSGVKGGMLALGAGAKYEQVFHKQNQVFYVLEGDVSYTCSNEKATLASGSFFIVPRDKQYIITNISNSAAKLVLVTCGI